MRTTLTLDDDVAARLDRIRKARRAGLRAVVNEALRLGLQAMSASPKPSEPYHTEPVDLGRCLVGNLDDVAEALAVAEGESFR
jgi:hypothetical protein